MRRTNNGEPELARDRGNTPQQAPHVASDAGETQHSGVERNPTLLRFDIRFHKPVRVKLWAPTGWRVRRERRSGAVEGRRSETTPGFARKIAKPQIKNQRSEERRVGK